MDKKIKNQNLEAVLEALLFIHGEPIDIKKILSTLKKQENYAQLEEGEIKTSLDILSENLKAENRGFSLIFSDTKIQLTTKPEFGGIFESFIKDELKEELTPAALETLAIIAYGGPISRNVIDYVRGVNSTFILRALLIRGLIERKSDPKRQNAYIYSVSFDFLKHTGLERNQNLPEYEKYRNVIEKLKSD